MQDVPFWPKCVRTVLAKDGCPRLEVQCGGRAFGSLGVDALCCWLEENLSSGKLPVTAWIDLRGTMAGDTGFGRMVSCLMTLGVAVERIWLHACKLSPAAVPDLRRLASCRSRSAAGPALRELHLTDNMLDDEAVFDLLVAVARARRFATEAPAWVRLEENMVREPSTVLARLRRAGITAWLQDVCPRPEIGGVYKAKLLLPGFYEQLPNQTPLGSTYSTQRIIESLTTLTDALDHNGNEEDNAAEEAAAGAPASGGHEGEQYDAGETADGDFSVGHASWEVLDDGYTDPYLDEDKFAYEEGVSSPAYASDGLSSAPAHSVLGTDVANALSRLRNMFSRRSGSKPKPGTVHRRKMVMPTPAAPLVSSPETAVAVSPVISTPMTPAPAASTVMPTPMTPAPEVSPLVSSAGICQTAPANHNVSIDGAGLAQAVSNSAASSGAVPLMAAPPLAPSLVVGPQVLGPLPDAPSMMGSSFANSSLSPGLSLLGPGPTLAATSPVTGLLPGSDLLNMPLLGGSQTTGPFPGSLVPAGAGMAMAPPGDPLLVGQTLPGLSAAPGLAGFPVASPMPFSPLPPVTASPMLLQPGLWNSSVGAAPLAQAQTSVAAPQGTMAQVPIAQLPMPPVTTGLTPMPPALSGMASAPPPLTGMGLAMAPGIVTDPGQIQWQPPATPGIGAQETAFSSMAAQADTHNQEHVQRLADYESVLLGNPPAPTDPRKRPRPDADMPASNAAAGVPAPWRSNRRRIQPGAGPGAGEGTAGDGGGGASRVAKNAAGDPIIDTVDL